jgi:hypothetical protein
VARQRLVLREPLPVDRVRRQRIEADDPAARRQRRDVNPAVVGFDVSRRRDFQEVIETLDTTRKNRSIVLRAIERLDEQAFEDTPAGVIDQTSPRRDAA